MTEDEAMAEERTEALIAKFREVDYLLAYGKICEARLMIAEVIGEPDELRLSHS